MYVCMYVCMYVYIHLYDDLSISLSHVSVSIYIKVYIRQHILLKCTHLFENTSNFVRQARNASISMSGLLNVLSEYG
jgi:hypothetical protein